MQWSEIRANYPNQWLIIDALEANTSDQQRNLTGIAVVETCSDGANAMSRYRQLHKEYPTRELYFVHTSREQLAVQERRWLGIRMRHPTFETPSITHLAA